MKKLVRMYVRWRVFAASKEYYKETGYTTGLLLGDLQKIEHVLVGG